MSTAAGRRTMPTHFAAFGGIGGKAHGPHNKHAQQVLARRAAIERKRKRAGHAWITAGRARRSPSSASRQLEDVQLTA